MNFNKDNKRKIMQLENLLKIRIGESIFGFNADKIEQILRVLPITSVPLSSEAIPGVCVILGKIFSIIDLGIVLGISSVNKDQESARILSISDDSALIVDEVLDIVKVEQENYEEVNDDELIVGFYKDKDQVVQILDEKKILQNIELIKYLPKEIDAINTNDTSSKQNNKNSSTTNRYLFFSANNEEFAIDIELLKEIIFVPEITPITSNKAMGMITLRDDLIVALDLKKVISIPEKENLTKEEQKENRLLILNYEGKSIALLVDSISEVKDIPLCDTEKLPERFADSKVESVYKTKEEIISIVSTQYLIDVTNEYKIQDEHETLKAEDKDNKEEENKEMNEIAAFQINNEEFALDIQNVQEIIKYTAITIIPEAPQYIDGVINLRGVVIPIVSLPERLGFVKEIKPKSKILICDIKGEKIGLFVDDVNEIMFIENKNVSKSNSEDSLFSEVITLDDGKRTILKLRITEVLDDNTLADIKMIEKN